MESSCDAAVQKYYEFIDRTKANSERMKEISELQKYIRAYLKTREIYAQYRRLLSKKQAEFYAEHTSAIISCEAAKRYFDSLGLKKLPSVQSLKKDRRISAGPYGGLGAVSHQQVGAGLYRAIAWLSAANKFYTDTILPAYGFWISDVVW